MPPTDPLTSFACRSTQRDRVNQLAEYVRQQSSPPRDSMPSARDVLEWLLELGEAEAGIEYEE